MMLARQFMIDAMFDVSADFHVLAAAGRAHLRVTLNLRTEAHASRAMNAAGHVGGNQGPRFLSLTTRLRFAEARNIAPVS